MKNKIGIARMLNLVNSKDFVIEPEIELNIIPLPIDTVSVFCFDGYAIASNGNEEFELSYPKIGELTAEQVDEIKHYRYADMITKDYAINYGDIMMCLGKANRI